MSVTLTTTPYYDDFDSTKNFYRILFKPGVPVQARELTQIQSILQDQIKKFANHIFVDGTRASKEDPSAVTITKDKHRSLKLNSLNSSNILAYIGQYVTGATSNTFGKVEFVFLQDDPTIGDPPTIVFRPLKGTGIFSTSEVLYFYNDIAAVESKANTYTGTETLTSDILVSVSGTLGEFSDTITYTSSSTTLKVGDQLILPGAIFPSDLFITEISSATSIRLNDTVGINGTNVAFSFIRRASSLTAVLHTSAGVYYKNGFFISVPEQ
jgi:hypothetical protein